MKLKKSLPILALLGIVFMSGCKKDAETFTYPTGTTSDPLNAAIDVSPDKVVAFTFNEAMDPSTINASTFT